MNALAMAHGLAIRIQVLGCLCLVAWGMCWSPAQGDDQLLNRRSTSQGGTATNRPAAAMSSSNCWELRFRSAPRTETSVVKLGDLVEVVSWGAQAEEGILLVPLAPAPKLGGTQDWTAKDVLHHLELRGLSQNQVRWLGPESVRLVRAQPTPAPTKRTKPRTPAFVQERTLAQAEANLVQATREYLWLKTGERTDWQVQVDVPPEYAVTLAGRRNIISLDGGQEPWAGDQVITFLVEHEGTELELDMELTIDLPPMVVVALHSLRRDEVVAADDVTLAPLPPRHNGQMGDFFESMDEVVGKQLRRSVSTGQPIGREMLGEPVVISSGELVEVESVSGAVSVKTAGKALSGGAIGDLINIELISTRKRVQATVMGPLQVRIASAPPLAKGNNP